MTTYANGKVALGAMPTFRNTGKHGHPTLIAHLGEAFDAVKRELGITLTVGAGQDIYRDYAGQVYWKNYWTRQGKPANAATPGFSNHGLGVCADITGDGARGTATFNKVAAIFARYSLHMDVLSEAWHVHDTSINIAGNKVTIVTPLTGVALIKAIQKVVGVTQDGIDGPKTKAAIKKWQAAHHLTADGIVGPVTRKAMGL